MFEHYQRFFGPPSGRRVFEPLGGGATIQVLEFANVFAGCAAFTTLGFGRYSAARGNPHMEVFAAVSEGGLHFPELLAKALFAVHAASIALTAGISVGGLSDLVPAFTKVTAKSAFYFCRPFLLPPAFHVPSEDTSILMVVPISGAEHEHVKQYGGDSLEGILAAREVDPFDVTRPSSI